MVHNSFCETIVTPWPQSKIPREKGGCGTIAHVNIDIKIPNKILVNQIQPFIKRKINHDSQRN